MEKLKQLTVSKNVPFEFGIKDRSAVLAFFSVVASSQIFPQSYILIFLFCKVTAKPSNMQAFSVNLQEIFAICSVAVHSNDVVVVELSFYTNDSLNTGYTITVEGVTNSGEVVREVMVVGKD